MNDTVSFFDPTLLMLFGFMILIYFIMIRPENKRRKSHQETLANLEVGDEIVTAGGILGTISKINDQFLEIIIADNVKLKIQKTSVSNALPKGTIKAI